MVETYSINRLFSIDEVRRFLKDHGIDLATNKVHSNLSELVVRFLLMNKEKNYWFALPDFPGILRKNIDKDFKNETIKEIKTNVRKSL